MIDGRGRFVGLKFDEGADQTDSHTYSYLDSREIYEHAGFKWGLERTEFDSLYNDLAK